MASAALLAKRPMFVRPSLASSRRTAITCPAVASYKVTLRMDKGREATIDCDSETYILDAVEASGVDLGFNCTAGGCASCAGRVISGTVDQSNQKILDDSQIQQGLAMLCTSLPMSDCVIEIRQDLCSGCA